MATFHTLTKIAIAHWKSNFNVNFKSLNDTHKDQLLSLLNYAKMLNKCID